MVKGTIKGYWSTPKLVASKDIYHPRPEGQAEGVITGTQRELYVEF